MNYRKFTIYIIMIFFVLTSCQKNNVDKVESITTEDVNLTQDMHDAIDNNDVLESADESIKLDDPNTVEIIRIENPSDGSTFKIRFQLIEPDIDSLVFNQIEIYNISELGEELIFDTKKVNYQYFVIYGNNTDYHDVVTIEDRDGDNQYEIYLSIQDDFGTKHALVVKRIQDRYLEVFYGPEYDTIEYIDE